MNALEGGGIDIYGFKGLIEKFCNNFNDSSSRCEE